MILSRSPPGSWPDCLRKCIFSLDGRGRGVPGYASWIAIALGDPLEILHGETVPLRTYFFCCLVAEKWFGDRVMDGWIDR